MDRREHTSRKVRQSPRVPIQTYRWEDVYRSRRKGGYPWTHLYKEPFDEDADPEEYTMEAMRRSKSPSTFDRSERSDGVEIEEVFDDDRSQHDKQYIEVDEPDFDSKSDRGAESSKEAQTCTIESADSSDNISQYLDREDRGPPKEERQQRATSEEPPRKRKLSGESSYSKISRLSLPKFNTLKKLTKARLPKITFPTSTLRKTKVKKASPPQTKKELKKHDFKNVTPEYIHIPLKPPEGETDQFSYLEFEEGPRPEKGEPEAVGGIGEQPSFKNIFKAMKKQKEMKKKLEDEMKKMEEDVIVEVVEDNKVQESSELKDDEVEVMDFTLQEPEEETKEEKPNEDVKEEKPNTEETKPVETKPKVVELDAHKPEVVEFQLKSVEQIDTEPSPSKVSSPDVDETEPESDWSSNQEQDPDVFDKLFNTPKSPASTSTEPPKSILKPVRAKSEEPPERKRKMSLESSYSRKSLSKLAFLKKLKDAKNKIKFPSFSNLLPKKAEKKPAAETIAEVKPKTSKKESLVVHKPKEPVYIHIPLKPPEGQSDEYSHLENQEQPLKVEKQEEQTDESTIESPESVEKGPPAFIFLTAPSDDEILDGPDVPETPSSENKFFGGRIDELKELAKEVVDEISPDSKKKQLESVREDEEKLDEYDKEDGLKITEAEAKAGLKQEGSPVFKKRVSFKRRSKVKDDDYEEVCPPKDDVLVVPPVLQQEVKEEEKIETKEEDDKVQLEQPKQLDDGDLEEDSKKERAKDEATARWSKISDHDYEPVNPPPEEAKESTKITEEPTRTESPEVRRSPTPQDTIIVQETTRIKPVVFTTSSLEESDQEPEPEPIPEPQKESKFQSALKQKAGQFKCKLQSIKKPNITINRPKFQKPNLQKLKINLPKIPDTARIHLPSFRSTTTTKVTIKRQESTESNAGDSKKHHFELPKFLKRHAEAPSQHPDSRDTERSRSTERFTAGYDASCESGDTNKVTFDFSTFPRFFRKTKQENKPKAPVYETSYTTSQSSRSTGQDSVRIPLHSEESMDNDYDLKHLEDASETGPSLIRYNQDIDIEDEEYSPDNMEIPDEGYNSRWQHGHFNKVTDLDSPDSPHNPNESFDLSGHTQSSHSSLDVRRQGVLEEINPDEFFLRQKGISQDNIEVGKYLSSEIREAFKAPTNALSDLHAYDIGSNQSLPEVQPAKKPARKNKRKKTPLGSEENVRYHEYDLDTPTRPQRTGSKPKNLNLLDEQDIQEIMSRYIDEPKPHYENEQMTGKEQPNIYLESASEDYRSYGYEPEVPRRRPKSLKSLNLSEHDSILGGDYSERAVEPSYEQEIDEENRYLKEKYNTYPATAPEIPELPVRPQRRSKSRKSSRSRSSSQFNTPAPVEEVVEEPCVKVIGDCMGYAIIDKSKGRDPPLPPPRTPPRRRRSIKSISSEKFATVPRTEKESVEPPTRPLRNYSTLSQVRSSRSRDKENVDIGQYIEIEDDGKKLVSGDIVQKMRDRPLPAPPRPPRKTRALKDITLEQHNVPPEAEDGEKRLQEGLEQVLRLEDEQTVEVTLDEEDIVCEEEDEVPVRRQIISTPTHITYEETITHGTLLVEPLNGAKLLPDEEFTHREHIIPVTVDSDDEDYPSVVPEDFKILRDPPVTTVHIASPIAELEVGRLRVNELLASKIIVQDIESETIQTNELSGKSGKLQISDVETPPPGLERQVTDPVVIADGKAPERADELREAPTPPPRADDQQPQRPPRRPAEPDVDDSPPPRPPQPIYLPSQPPASFYALRAHKYVTEDIPAAAPRRRRAPRPASRSSSEEWSAEAARARRLRSPEPTIAQLSGQLARACVCSGRDFLKRLIVHVRENVVRNQDGHQDVHVITVILLVLIAGLLLLGMGDEKTVVHMHHWEFFNPPKDM